MKSNLFALAMLVAISTLFGACGSASSPTGPSGPTTHTQQPPNENGYTPLGTKQYLTDANGATTKMWAELVSVIPFRGSHLVTGPFSQAPDCSLDCYAVTVMFGLDVDPSNSGSAAADFRAQWTMDGVGDPSVGSPSDTYNGQYTVICGSQGAIGIGTGLLAGTQQQCSAGPGAISGGGTKYTPFAFVPQFITIMGESQVGKGPYTVGRTSFVTGYQHL